MKMELSDEYLHIFTIFRPFHHNRIFAFFQIYAGFFKGRFEIHLFGFALAIIKL